MNVEARQPPFVPGFFIVTVAAQVLLLLGPFGWTKNWFQLFFTNFPIQ